MICGRHFGSQLHSGISMEPSIAAETPHNRVYDEGRAIRSARGTTAPSRDVLGRVREFYDRFCRNRECQFGP